MMMRPQDLPEALQNREMGTSPPPPLGDPQGNNGQALTVGKIVGLLAVVLATLMVWSYASDDFIPVASSLDCMLAGQGSAGELFGKAACTTVPQGATDLFQHHSQPAGN